jgi:hypothetical protein
MINYILILSENYANKKWTLDGNSYDGLIWLDESPKPTKSELDALLETTKEAITAKQQAVIASKTSALTKLSKLGLTEDEIKALIG